MFRNTSCYCHALHAIINYMSKIEVRCTPEFKERVKKAAHEFEMSVANYIRWVLNEILKDK